MLLRHIDFEALEDWQRGNKLDNNEAVEIEYAVHGWWRADPSDQAGSGGCWWVSLKELLSDDEDPELFIEPGLIAIKAAIESFETRLVANRRQQWDDLLALQEDEA